uniref:MFS transporter n=1 Tax=Chryseobacterium sp. TaxID=1871047 RepID=UPI0023F349E2
IVAVSVFCIMLDVDGYMLALGFQNGLKISPLDAGEIIVFQGLGFILASVLSVKLILRYGKKALIAGLFFIIVVLVFQLFLFRMETGFPVFCLLLFLHGLGIGSVIPSLATIALSGMSEKLIGNASGVYNTFQQIAAIVGIVAVGSIFYYFLGEKPVVKHYNNAFSVALLINIFCLIFVMICIFKVPDHVLPETRHKK